VLVEENGPWRARRQAIESALSFLAGSAPVVWIGAAGEGLQTTLAVRSGAVDFVRARRCACRGDHHGGAAAERLREIRTGLTARTAGSFSLGELRLDDRDFGEVLRHELNIR